MPLNTGLQLERLPSKRVIYDYTYQKRKKVKDYKALLPVLTLVWLADDSLGFNDDYVAYVMTPEMVVDFIKNDRLWHKPEIVKREGMKEGMREGIKDGMEECMRIGKKVSILEIARRLREKGFDDGFIADVSGLSWDQIASL